MLALLAANSYLGIEDANLQHFYWFMCGSSHACSMPCRVQVNRSLFYGAAREKGILDYISTTRKNPGFK